MQRHLPDKAGPETIPRAHVNRPQRMVHGTAPDGPVSANSAHVYPWARAMYNEYMPPTLTYTLATQHIFGTMDALAHMPGIYQHDPRPNITIQDFITEAPQANMHLGVESIY
jgi:hypothetical protein